MSTDNQTTWWPPSEPSGGQCIAVDENGDECCAFYSPYTGKWYLCSNVVMDACEFEPRAWTPLPRYREPI